MPTNERARGSTPMLRRAVRNSPFLSSVSPAGMTVLETAAYIAIFAMCVLFLYYGSSVLMNTKNVDFTSDVARRRIFSLPPTPLRPNAPTVPRQHLRRRLLFRKCHRGSIDRSLRLRRPLQEL